MWVVVAISARSLAHLFRLIHTHAALIRSQALAQVSICVPRRCLLQGDDCLCVNIAVVVHPQLAVPALDHIAVGGQPELRRAFLMKQGGGSEPNEYNC